MPRTKLPLDKFQNATKLERERLLKKQAGEDKEKLEAMGQESNRKAAKWIIEENKKKEAADKKEKDDSIERLYDARGKVFTYKDAIIGEMKREMAHWDDDLPIGFHWLVQNTQEGIVLWIQNPQRQYYAKGLRLSGEPDIDLQAIARMIIEAVKEMDKQAEPKNDSGIILPYK